MAKEYDVSLHPRLVEQKKKKRRVFLRRLSLFTLFFITLIFGLAYFSAHPSIVVSKITINGNKIVSDSKIREITDSTMEGRYVHLFKRTNIFLYPKYKIIKNIKNEFSRIKNVEIKSTGLNDLIIDIDEYEGAYMWCGEQFVKDDVNSDEECYFVNLDGYIFDRAPFFSGNIYFKFYSPLNNKDLPPLSNEILTPEKIKDIFFFSDELEKMSFSPAFIDTHDKDEQRFYLKRKNDDTLPTIIFKEDSDLELIIENLSASMKQEEFVDEVKGKYDLLDYIDLRYKNKVIYKHYE